MTASPNAYEILGVHPTAPGDLISAVYWKAIDEIQAEREAGHPVDQILHLLTRAYSMVSTSEVRAGYNIAIGQSREPISTRRLPRRGLFRRTDPIDYYEVLGLHESAPQEVITTAYNIMRMHYLRLDMNKGRRSMVLQAAEQARTTLGNEASRRRYDMLRGAPDKGASASTLRVLLTWLRSLLRPKADAQPRPATLVGRLWDYARLADVAGAQDAT